MSLKPNSPSLTPDKITRFELACREGVQNARRPKEEKIRSRKKPDRKLYDCLYRTTELDRAMNVTCPKCGRRVLAYQHPQQK